MHWLHPTELGGSTVLRCDLFPIATFHFDHEDLWSGTLLTYVVPTIDERWHLAHKHAIAAD